MQQDTEWYSTMRDIREPHDKVIRVVKQCLKQRVSDLLNFVGCSI